MAQPYLDHLVLLVSHSTLHSPPSWLTSAFHFYPGGTHAGGLTANDLILFPDGTYLELIAFLPHVTPEQRLTHKWGRQKEGHFVDFALSLPAVPDKSVEELFAPIAKRVDSGGSLRYTSLTPGGRTQKDGTEMKWAISSAERLHGTPIVGELPFWCLDRTPRALRVPYQVRENVKHPSGAKGIAAVDVVVSSREVQEVYKFITLAEGRGREEEGGKSWDLAVPEGSSSVLRVSVEDQAAAGTKEKISLTVLTEQGGVSGRIGGKIEEGVELWIELKPE